MELISVVVPVYNDERNISRCAESILSQTYTALEIIFVNDGSADKTGEICDGYAARDERVKVIHKQNGGPQSAVIAGVGAARGEYIVFCDSDDWLSDDIIKRLYETLKDQKADGVRCGFLRHESGAVSEVGALKSRLYDKEEIENEILFSFFEETGSINENWSNSRWGKIYRTRLLRKALAGCNSELSIGEDLEMNLRYLALCGSVYVLSGYYGYCYISREGSITNTGYSRMACRYLLLLDVLRELASQQKRKGRAVNRCADMELTEAFFMIVEGDGKIMQKRRSIKKIIPNLAGADRIKDKIAECKPYVKWSFNIMLRRSVFWGLIMYDVIQRAAKLLNR